MQSVLIVIHILIVIALVAVVLLQRSEGGVLGSGGGSGNFMTGRGQANALSRATAILGDAVLRHLDPDVDHRRLEPHAAFDPAGDRPPRRASRRPSRSVRATFSTS